MIDEVSVDTKEQEKVKETKSFSTRSTCPHVLMKNKPNGKKID